MHQYDSTIISFWVRTRYSASMMQKRGLDWTLNMLYNEDLKHHCPNMTERLIRCQTACMENTVFIHMYSKLIIILVTSIIAALPQLSRLPFPGEPSSQETAPGMLPDLPLSVCVLVDFAWMVWYLFLYHHLGKVGCKIWCGALYLHSTPS